MVRSRHSLLLVGMCVSACASLDEEPLPSEPNTPPVAALRTPVIAPTARAITLDASGSFDEDGSPLTFSFEFNDGTPAQLSSEATLSHTFSAAGLYTVRVRVTDIAGAEAWATQDIAVRDEFPEPPNFCEKSADCVVGDECDGGICYATGGALD